MSTEPTPSGVTVGEVTGDVTEAFNTDILDDAPEVQPDQQEIDELLGGESEGDVDDASMRFEMPENMPEITPDGKRLVIRFYASKCFSCGHLRPAVKDSLIPLDQPCLYTKGNDRCPAQHFQLTSISKYEKITARLLKKMQRAKDGQDRLSILAEFQEAMKGATPKRIDAGLHMLKQYL